MYTFAKFNIPDSSGCGINSLDYSWAIRDVIRLAKKSPYHDLIRFEYVKINGEIVGLHVDAVRERPLSMKLWVSTYPIIFTLRKITNAVKYLVGWWNIDVSWQFCKRSKTVIKRYGEQGMEITYVVFIIPWLGLIKRYLTNDSGSIVIRDGDPVFEWLWANPFTVYHVMSDALISQR